MTKAKTFYQKIKTGLKMEGVPPPVRRVIIAVVGMTVLLIGIALIVLPGPAFIVIPLGLAILGTEFAWARLYLKKARRALDAVKAKVTGNKTSGQPAKDRNRECPPSCGNS